jgi:hypothetical protein
MASLNNDGLWNEQYFKNIVDDNYGNYTIDLIDYTYRNYIYKLTLQSKIYLLKISEVTTRDSSIHIHIDSVIDEVEKQIEIYNATIEQPLCPKIFYHNKLSIDDIIKLRNHTSDTKDSKDSFDSILSYLIPDNTGGGNSIKSNNTAPYFSNNENINGDKTDKMVYVICMEYLDNYNILYSLPRPIFDMFYNELIIQGFQIIIELLIKTGYAHGDFHLSNILYNINDTTHFYKGLADHKINSNHSTHYMLNTRPILIDFGDSYKISPQELVRIKDMYRHKQYMDIIEFMCKDTKARRNLTRVIYEYICKTNLDKDLINKKIRQYFQMREHNIEVFDFYPVRSKNNKNGKNGKNRKTKNRSDRNDRNSRNNKTRSRSRNRSERAELIRSRYSR